MKKLSFLFLTIGIIWGCWAESPKREFRATWLASVSNIDWPKSDPDFGRAKGRSD